MTHWKTLANLDYIGAYALAPGEDLTVTIQSVRRQEVIGSGGRKSECVVATLDAPNRPLILNATNSKSIEKMYGPYIEEWAGKRITLYASTTQVKGESVDCLRIRPVVEKPGISDERLDKAIGAIKAGTYTREQLLDRCALTPEQETRLNA